MRGCDFAWLPAGLDLHRFARQLKADGFDFVVRYLSHDPSKNLSRAEVAAYRRVGMHIVTVWEATPDAALGGAAEGMTDAKAAKELLRELGAPEHAPVYFACDFAVAPDQMPIVDAYLDSTAFVMSQDLNGVYGDYTAVGARHVRYRWQTVAWSNGLWRKTNLIQPGINSGNIMGVAWDIDDSKAADFGQWQWPSHRKPKAPAKPKKHRVKKVVHKTGHVAKKEPVMTSGVLLSTLTTVVTFLFPHLGLPIYRHTLDYVELGLVTLAGVGVAVFARPVRMGVYTVIGGAMSTLIGTFGVHIPAVVFSSQTSILAPFIALMLRSHVSPKGTPEQAALAPLDAPSPYNAAQAAIGRPPVVVRPGNQPANPLPQ